MATWSINPYALAQIITGSRLEDKSRGDVEAYVKRAFRVDDLTELFVGKGGRPARLAQFRALTDLVRKPERLEDVMGLAPVRELAVLVGEQTLRRALPFVVPISNAVFADQAREGEIDVGGWHDVSAVLVEDASWRDPVQGATADCYLVSAMIAVAWAVPNAWRDELAAGIQSGAPTKNFDFDFYTGAASRDVATRVALRLPDDPGQHPIYAHSSQANEAWPGLVEKAFVTRVRQLAADPTPADYQAIGDARREPQAAAQMLCGGVTKRQTQVGGDKLSDHVQSLCDDRRVTTLPVMAWTYSYDAPMSGPAWTENGLMKEHAYAVLGWCAEGGKEFIVLRDPHGTSLFDPATYAVGPWKPGSGPQGEPEVKLNVNGVFGIPREWFDGGMVGLGWVDRSAAGIP